MPEDWSKPHEIDPLADAGAEFAFAIPLADLPRLRGQLARPAGEVVGSVRFARTEGRVVADVRIAAQVPLTCQRCLAPLDWPIESRGAVVLVANAAQAERLPGDLETILAPEHRISVRDLAEEELLLVLPIVPRHAPGGCTGARSVRNGEPAGARAAQAEHHRPFAGLDELMKKTR